MERRSSCAGWSVALAVSLVVGCGGDDRAEVTPTSGSATGVTSAQSSSSGAGGGAGGAPGTGGEDAQGGGGSSGEGGSSSAGGGAGGEPSWDTCETPADCLGDEESICPENACEDGDLFFACDETGDPPRAYFACVVAADYLRTNVWGLLVDCFREPTPEELCAGGDDLVAACLAEAEERACENSPAADACAAVAESCDDPAAFPTATCEQDLLLYNAAALEAYLDCIPQVTDASCEEQHATCVSVLFTF